jgi:hypothetical protein
VAAANYVINLTPTPGGGAAPVGQSGIPTAPPTSAMPSGAMNAGMEDLNSHLRRMQGMQEKFVGTPADVEVSRQMVEEKLQRDRRLDVLKERHKQDTAAMEAGRAWEEEKLWHDRRMAVMKERHRIDGAAAEEARRALQTEKDNREWQEQVNAERRKQDPGSARAEDLGALGGLLSQMGLGRIGGLLQHAPNLQEQLGLFDPQGGPGGSQGTAQQAQQMARQFSQQQAGGSQGGQAAQGSKQAAQQAAKSATQQAGQSVTGEAAGAAAGEAAGGMGGMAAAAGPVGAALAVGIELQGMLADAIGFAAKGIEGFGRSVGRVVQDDFASAFIEGREAYQDMIATVPIVGETMANLDKVMLAPIKSFVALERQFQELGTKLQAFSGSITLAQAEAEMRGLEGDIREAESLGPELARMTEVSSKLHEEVREMAEPVKKAALEITTVGIEAVRQIAPAVYEKLMENPAVQLLSMNVGVFVQALKAWLNLKEPEDDRTLDDLINTAFGRVRENNLQAGQGQGRGANERMNPPILGGGF